MSSEFLPDDFDEINTLYFKEIRRKKIFAADPSGWLNTVHGGKHLIPSLTIATEEMHRYHSDEDFNLSQLKRPILESISLWDSCEYAYDNITLCQSVTVGSTIVLECLRKMGIRLLILETPVYFATVAQAEALGFQVHLIPSYIDDNFEYDQLEMIRHFDGRPLAVWISQPRMALGTNQNTSQLKKVQAELPRTSYLVIDEANEQYWPSHLHQIQTTITDNVIKIRSLTKGIGLNGLRCAYIAHSERLRPALVEAMESFQGGLDYESLSLVLQLTKNPEVLRALLHASHAQVQSLRKRAEIEVIPPMMILTQIDNGYIGSVALEKIELSGKGENFRTSLLQYCSKRLCPIILGSTMRFAVDPHYDFVRLNYYNEISYLIRGLQILREFYGA